MKKTITSLALLALGTIGFCQTDTVKVTDFDLLHTGFYQYENGGYSSDILPSLGADQVWDYSGYGKDSTITQVIKELSEAPDPTFEGANMVNHINDKEWHYINKDETGVYLLASDLGDGNGVGLVLPVKSFPEMVYLGSKDSSFVEIMPNYGMAIVLTGEGNGTITTPNGTYHNVVLVKSEITACQGAANALSCEVQDISYSWHQKDRTFGAIAQLDGEGDDYEFSWHEEIPVLDIQSGNVGASKAINVYPSLVKNTVTINGADFDQFEVYDMEGELVFKNASNVMSQDLSFLTQGAYVYKVYNNNVLLNSGKLIKQ